MKLNYIETTFDYNWNGRFFLIKIALRKSTEIFKNSKKKSNKERRGKQQSDLWSLQLESLFDRLQQQAKASTDRSSLFMCFLIFIKKARIWRKRSWSQRRNHRWNLSLAIHSPRIAFCSLFGFECWAHFYVSAFFQMLIHFTWFFHRRSIFTQQSTQKKRSHQTFSSLFSQSIVMTAFSQFLHHSVDSIWNSFHGTFRNRVIF